MGNLTAGEAIKLIEDFSITPSAIDMGKVQQSLNSVQSEEPAGGIDFLKRYMGTQNNGKEKVSAQSVGVWIQLFHDGALEAVKKSLAGIPASQPLSEMDLDRIQTALEYEKTLVETNAHEFKKINSHHFLAMKDVVSRVSAQLSQVIREAASHRQDMADMAT